MREITPDVVVEDRYSAPDTYRGCSYGYVRTADGPVVIDTPQFPADAVAFREDLAAEGEVRFVVNTHEHLDHVAGNHFLPGEVVAHEAVRETVAGPPGKEMALTTMGILFDAELAREQQRSIERLGEDDLDWATLLELIVAEFDPKSLHHMDGYDMRQPSVTFDESATLHVGHTPIELLHLPGHTASHVCVHLPEQSILFAGDNVTTGCYPSMSRSRPLAWIDSLEAMEALDVDTVVPGHGPVAGPDSIREFREFLETCLDRVRTGIEEGKSVDELVETISFPDGWPAMHPVEASDRLDVEQLYEALA